MSIMPWGLLWYEADGAMVDRVSHAAERYVDKHGALPNCCFVHPADYEEDAEIEGIRVIRHSSVLKNHFWIGENGEL